MIVDCFTHTWERSDSLGISPGQVMMAPVLPSLVRDAKGLPLADTERHFAACEHAAVTLVSGFTSRHLGAAITNDHVARYVRLHPDRLIGFAGIDPGDWRSALDELRRARNELGLMGASVSPAAQDFHPSDSKAMRVYQLAADLGMPLLFHPGITLAPGLKMEYARPLLLDEIAREIPTLRIVIAHLGFPWVDETALLLAKHENVFAEISWVVQHPWRAYQAIMSMHEQGVMHKLLFGSGFPFASTAQTIERLYDVNQVCQGTHWPTLPRRELKAIVERDALSLLGIESAPVLQRLHVVAHESDADAEARPPADTDA